MAPLRFVPKSGCYVRKELKTEEKEVRMDSRSVVIVRGLFVISN